MSALHGTFALEQMHGVSMRVGEDLDLDVVGGSIRRSTYKRVVTEGGLGLSPRGVIASATSSGVRATFFPIPPPPAEGLTRTGTDALNRRAEVRIR